MEIKKSKTYEVIDIINWYEAGELIINPKYQRNPVWDETAKSFLIDTIMRDYPMPPLFYRQMFYLEERKTKREVIDGQQRTRAIIGFYDNEFPILRKHNAVFGGKFFKDLLPEDQEHFLKYSIFVDMIYEKDDSIIYDIFARMNSNAANINKQEIRNAKFWGDFKTSVYSVASDVRDFFISYNTFTNKNLARMMDLEFISSLFVLAMDGCTTGSSAQLDKYYKDYDKGFENAALVEGNIKNAFDFINGIYNFIDENIFVFKNKNYLYDLIGYYFVATGVIQLNSHSIFKLPKADYLANKLIELHYELEKMKGKRINKDELSNQIVTYERNHKVHSNSKEAREERIEFLIGYLK